MRLQIPVVSAAILGFEGQLSVFHPYEGPCYRCLFPQPPPAELAPSCGANGVLGVLPGTMGLLQATEVIKLIVGAGEPLVGRLLMYDALAATTTELKVRRDPECPICSRAAGRDRRRRDGRLPGLRGVLRGGGLGSCAMATIRIPPVLRPSVGGEREVSADGDNVGEVLHALAEAHPADPEPALRPRGRPQPLRQRLPQRRGRARARRPRDAGRRVGHARHPAGHGRRRLTARPRAPSNARRGRSTPTRGP